jgi:hypothetical protein
MKTYKQKLIETNSLINKITTYVKKTPRHYNLLNPGTTDIYLMNGEWDKHTKGQFIAIFAGEHVIIFDAKGKFLEVGPYNWVKVIPHEDVAIGEIKKEKVNEKILKETSDPEVKQIFTKLKADLSKMGQLIKFERLGNDLAVHFVLKATKNKYFFTKGFDFHLNPAFGEPGYLYIVYIEGVGDETLDTYEDAIKFIKKSWITSKKNMLGSL